MSAYTEALLLAIDRHGEQVDKSGMPYILHLICVSQKGETDAEMITGVLHDILEDTDTTIAELMEEFGPIITEAVILLTKKPHEPNEQYYRRIRKNPLALTVKINDIEDNMDSRRLEKLPVEEQDRLIKKYRHAVQILLESSHEH